MKKLVFWILIGVSALLLWEVVRSGSEQRVPEISYSQFMSEADAGEVASVKVTGNQILGEYRNGKGSFRLTGPSNPGTYLNALHDHGAQIWFRDTSNGSLPLQLIGTWAPLLLLAALWFYLVRLIRGRNVPPGLGDNRGSPGGLR
jgi:cell division protease FtsH